MLEKLLGSSKLQRSVNKKKNAKVISTFDFSTLYTKIPHDKVQIKELSEVIDFVFAAGSHFETR